MSGAAQVPPVVWELGIKYASGQITGGTARTLEMLKMLKEVIADYKTPPQKTLSRDLTSRITAIITFVKDCRPMSASMGEPS